VQVAKRLGVAALVAGSLALSGCSSAPPREVHVVVRVAPSVHPAAYDVHLAQAKAGFRSEFELRSGQTKTVTVPAGWVTVRVAGLCVVPAPATATTTVEVRPDDCTVT
jgi:hypothetical protein